MLNQKDKKRLKKRLDEAFRRYANPDFIPDDPLSIPHRYTHKEDCEIAGFFAACFAWGQRVTIINKCNDLLARMDHAPAQFIRQHKTSDLKRMEGFVHRTFNTTDALFFIDALKRIYTQHGGLEKVISQGIAKEDKTIEGGLNHLHRVFFSVDYAPKRSRKHLAAPMRGSTCKRLAMFLRWMVRPRTEGVDLGLWTQIRPAQLQCPLDVHVARVARGLGLLQRKQNDWKAVCELTDNLRLLDPNDPVKYDMALFGLGIHGD